MILVVHAKPGSRVKSIQKINETEYKISVTAPAHKGLANMAIRKVLCDYFGLPPAHVVFKSGYRSREKKFEIIGK